MTAFNVLIFQLTFEGNCLPTYFYTNQRLKSLYISDVKSFSLAQTFTVFLSPKILQSLKYRRRVRKRLRWDESQAKVLYAIFDLPCCACEGLKPPLKTCSCRAILCVKEPGHRIYQNRHTAWKKNRRTCWVFFAAQSHAFHTLNVIAVVFRITSHSMQCFSFIACLNHSRCWLSEDSNIYRYILKWILLVSKCERRCYISEKADILNNIIK